MSVNRYGLGIGVLDGAMYAVGGMNGSVVLNSVEVYRPSSGIWTSIPNMHLGRYNPGNGFKKICLKKCTKFELFF